MLRAASTRPSRPSIPRTVWLLGLVSLLMDVSTEMVQTLLPVYLVGGLGLSAIMIGVIEGAAVTVAMTTRLFSGWLSDHIRQRKSLTLLGYGLGALAKPLFPMAESAGTVLGAKFIDRIGKGIRSAPRDAMIADVSPAEIRGAAFGLRKSLDTVGGFLGPLIAIAIMLASGDDIRLVFWLAVIPAALAIAVLGGLVREPEQPAVFAGKPRTRLTLADSLRLNRSVWWVIGLGILMTLARISEAFLLLRTHQIGWPLAWLPLVIVLMHAVYGLTAYPAGRLFDRAGPRVALIAGMACMAGAALTLAVTHTLAGMVVAVVLWGVHMGLTQGVLAALVAQRAPAHLKGTAFGVLSLGTGLAVLTGNVLAGVAWEVISPATPFLISGVLSIAAAVLAWRLRPSPQS